MLRPRWVDCAEHDFMLIFQTGDFPFWGKGGLKYEHCCHCEWTRYLSFTDGSTGHVTEISKPYASSDRRCLDQGAKYFVTAHGVSASGVSYGSC